MSAITLAQVYAQKVNRGGVATVITVIMLRLKKQARSGSLEGAGARTRRGPERSGQTDRNLR